MLLVQSIGRSLQAGINVDLFFTPRRGMFGNVRYGYSRTMNDADDALTPPPNATFETEWASSRGESRHRFNWNIGGQVGPPSWGLNMSINGRVFSGTPYNITTGRDENRDAIFNDRPAGVPRNSLRGEAIVQTDSRVSWIIRGRPINAQVPFSAQRGPGGGGQGGRPGGPGPGGRGPGGPNQNQGKRLEMYLSVQNLFNRVNYSSYVGVLTSPYFGRPTSAQAARRMELGWRFSF
jgi:hypothetical protein